METITFLEAIQGMPLWLRIGLSLSLCLWAYIYIEGYLYWKGQGYNYLKGKFEEN